MQYKFKFKKHLFYHSRLVIGHHYEESQDKMVLYFESGAIEEISHWKSCSCKLGTDWVLAVKKKMEEEAKQKVV